METLGLEVLLCITEVHIAVVFFFFPLLWPEIDIKTKLVLTKAVDMSTKMH